MDDRSCSIPTALRRRKTAVLPLPRLMKMKNDVGIQPINDDLIKTRTRSVNTPSKWQSSARAVMNHRKLSRKYSDSLLPQRNNQWLNQEDSNFCIRQDVRRLPMKRSMSLAQNDRNGLMVNEDVLLRDERWGSDHRPSTVATFGRRRSLDDIMWSRYWHDARNRTNVRAYSFTNEANIQRKELIEEKVACNETETSEAIEEPKIGKAGDVDEELAIHVHQLSLKERLEKIEQERGFVVSQYERE